VLIHGTGIHERLGEEKGNTMMEEKNGKKKEDFEKRNEDMKNNKYV
jgi:hypothetical protein